MRNVTTSAPSNNRLRRVIVSESRNILVGRIVNATEPFCFSVFPHLPERKMLPMHTCKICHAEWNGKRENACIIDVASPKLQRNTDSRLSVKRLSTQNQISTKITNLDKHAGKTNYSVNCLRIYLLEQRNRISRGVNRQNMC